VEEVSGKQGTSVLLVVNLKEEVETMGPVCVRK